MMDGTVDASHVNQAGDASRECRPKLVVGVPIWGGQKYVDQFLELSWPSLLAPKNLPLLSRTFEISIEFLLDGASAACLDTHRASGAFGKWKTRFTVIEELDDWSSRPGVDKYHVATLLFRWQVLEARGNHLLVWNFSDFVWPNGTASSLVGVAAASLNGSDSGTVIATAGLPIAVADLASLLMTAQAIDRPAEPPRPLVLATHDVLDRLQQGSCGGWFHRHTWGTNSPGYRSFAFFESEGGVALKMFDLHPIVFEVNDWLRNAVKRLSGGTIDGCILPALQQMGLRVEIDPDLRTGVLVVPSAGEHELWSDEPIDFFSQVGQWLAETSYPGQKVRNFEQFAWVYPRSQSTHLLLGHIQAAMSEPTWQGIAREVRVNRRPPNGWLRSSAVGELVLSAMIYLVASLIGWFRALRRGSRIAGRLVGGVAAHAWRLLVQGVQRVRAIIRRLVRWLYSQYPQVPLVQIRERGFARQVASGPRPWREDSYSTTAKPE